MKKYIFILIFLNFTNIFAQYELEWKKEILISTSSLAAFGASFLISNQSDTTFHSTNYNINDVFIIDKFLAQPYNKTYNDISDITLMVNLLAPIAVNFNQFKNSWTVPVMYSETILATSALTYLIKNIIQRPRPFNYFDIQDKSELTSFDSQLSFFSGHSSMSFAAATFNSIIFSRFNPNSEYKDIVWISSLTSASLTAILRVMAGKHYFTDVLTGAAVGTLMSYLITELHEVDKNSITNTNTIVPLISLQFNY